jgi:hypothetical protein
LKYKREPIPDKKEELSKRFDALFATTTDYEELNERILKTLAKKTALLQVLELPLLPLHNNAAELGARVQARVRDVSFQTRSEKGTLIKDTFMTINQTAKITRTMLTTTKNKKKQSEITPNTNIKGLTKVLILI